MKFLFNLLAWCTTALGAVDADGWAPLEQPKQRTFEETLEEADLSVWTVFIKQLGPEKFFVRFCGDPQYTYLSKEEMEMRSSQEGEEYHLWVLKAKGEEFLDQRKREVEALPNALLVDAVRSSPELLDLVYRLEGKWIFERLLLTPHHLYFFQTTSEAFLGEEGHRKFVNSLSLQTSE